MQALWKATRILYISIILIVTIIIAALIAVQAPAVQTYMAKRALEYLNNAIEGTISIGKVHIDPFKAVVLKDVAIIDKKPFRDSTYRSPVDTMFRAKYITTTFSIKNLSGKGGIRLSSAKVTDGMFFLTIEPSDNPGRSNTLNLKRIFKIKGSDKKKEDNGKDIFSIGSVKLEKMSFKMKNFTKDASVYGSDSMNWFDLDVEDIELSGRKMKMKGKVMSAICDKMSFREKSGYKCFLISGKTKAGNGRVIIDNLRLIDRWSNIDIPEFCMSYSDGNAWSDFMTAVRMTGDISTSTVSMKSLGYFAPALKKFNMTARIEGKVDGYVNDLKFDNILFQTSDAEGFTSWDKHSRHGIEGNFSGSIIGLPDTRAMLMEAKIKSLKFTTQGLEHLIKGFAPQAKVKISNISRHHSVQFKGLASGPLNRLKINGTFRSGTGTVKANADIRNLIDSKRPIILGGVIRTEGLDISEITPKKLPVGKCDLVTGLSATLNKDNTEVNIDSLKISRLNVLGYDYSGINAVGRFSQDAFDGRIVCSDPNLNFLFQGIFSLSSKTQNALYQFYANVGYADLNALNIDKRGTSKISLRTQANFTRVSGEDILGNIDIDDIVLEDTHGIHNIGNVEISSHAGNNLNRIRFTSSFAEGTFVGSRFLSSFLRDLQTVSLRRELPALYKTSASEWSGNSYELSFLFHDTKDILSFFAPGAYIAENTSISLKVGQEGNLKTRLKSERIAYKDKYVKGIDFTSDNLNNVLRGKLSAAEISASPVLTKSNILDILAEKDSLSISFAYNNEGDSGNRGKLRLAGNLFRDSNDSLGMMFSFMPSYLDLNSRHWEILSSPIEFTKARTHLDSLVIKSSGQSINVTGSFSRTQTDTLHLNMDRVDMSMANAFTDIDMRLGGLVSGHAMLISPISNNGGILMNVSCDSTSFAGKRIGKVRLASVWDEESRKLNYICRNSLDSTQNFSVAGNFYPKTRQIEGKVSLNSLDLGYAMPFISSIFSSAEGSLSGDIAFIGPLDKIGIASRNLFLEKARLKVGFTNVEYTASGPFSIDSKGLNFNNILINDRYGSSGHVNGNIGWNYFKDINFNTQISFSGMQVLSTSETDSPIFYGNLFASGDLSISGPLSALRLSANARTEKTGNIHIPISSSASAGTSNLLTFKEPYKEMTIDPYEEMLARLKSKEKKANDLGIKLKITATPGVSADIEIDKATGNVLSGSGNGLIELDIRPSADFFNINGNYNIVNGIYHFVAMGIAKRDFTIQEGSSVKFNGDIMDSDLDINAIYKTKASVGTLIADTTSTSTRRLVECGISISDKIRNPRLGFSINIPDLDPTTQTRVESALNTQDKVQKQLLALLVTNSFIPDEQSGITNSSSSMLLSNVTEIMSGQLNNILQKLDIPVDFGFDYQQNASGSNIFDVALSTALFNNRVIVNGTIGNRQYDSKTSNSSEVVGDLDIDVKLDRSGNIRLNLFSHSADQYTNYLDNSQRNGVGITYQKEYNTIGEFIRNLFRSKKRRQEIEAARQQELINQRNIKIRIQPADNEQKQSRKNN